MKVITFEDINALGITPAECYSWSEFVIRNKKKAILPPKISMKPRDGVFCNVMPSIIPGNGEDSWGGVKVVTRYPHRVPSLESRILLEDADTGEFLALMDGTWITTMRTGAVAAHSVELLARSDFSTIGIMGLGNVSRSTMLILADRMPDREMKIKLLKYKGQEESFAERFKAYPNLSFTYVDTPEEMVSGSDVVLSGATFLPNNVCEDKYFDEGVLVQPIHTLGFTNCDLFFDKVFADDTGHVKNFKYFDRFRSFAEVGEVVNGEKPGRTSDSERILVYNIGISVHDIYYAASIYDIIKEKGGLDALPDIDMKDPTVKFWV
ncbi:MAG: ornithine cyclodeaminase [Clostridiales bacterium]|nr:ornithine cyclodeaminase [Clostridiales bacterium]